METTKLEFLKEFFETFHKNRKFRDDGHVLCKSGIQVRGRSYFVDLGGGENITLNLGDSSFTD